ncbi:pseudouridine synthase [Haematococcus lacustris]
MRPQLQTPKHASPQRIAINVKGAARACATRLASSLGLQPTANQVAAASAAVKDPSSAGYEGRGRGDSSALREPGSTGPRLPGAKRACALHCAYVGTTFRGLQVIRDAPVEDSIEAVLELALLQGTSSYQGQGMAIQAGLIAPSNYGDLFKLKWSRSSRTDKGVHSLATVIGVKLVVQDADVVMEADKEGLGLATRINQHLPPSVRATYNHQYHHYPLPPSALHLDDLVGTAPPSNLTLHLAPLPCVLAVQKVNKAFSARRSCITRTYEYYLPAWLLGVHGDGRHEDSLRMGLVRQVLASFCGTHPFHNFTARVKDYELSNAQLASKAKTEEPRYLNPGGLLCVKLQVTGSSFMLNQIRHMVGAVVAVSRGCCSANLVRAALTSPAKVTFPKAPPHTLLLGANTFLPFRPAGTEAEAPVSRFTGKALELREQGRSNQTQFRKEVLNPALEQLLQHPDWALYDQLHDKAYWDVQAADKVVQSHAAWVAARQPAVPAAAAGEVGGQLKHMKLRLPHSPQAKGIQAECCHARLLVAAGAGAAMPTQTSLHI